MAKIKITQANTQTEEPLTRGDALKFLSARLEQLKKEKKTLFERLKLLEDQRFQLSSYLEHIRRILEEKKIDPDRPETYYLIEAGARIEHEKDTPCAEISVDIPEIMDEYYRTQDDLEKINAEIREIEDKVKKIKKEIDSTEKQIKKTKK